MVLIDCRLELQNEVKMIFVRIISSEFVLDVRYVIFNIQSTSLESTIVHIAYISRW